MKKDITITKLRELCEEFNLKYKKCEGYSLKVKKDVFY